MLIMSYILLFINTVYSINKLNILTLIVRIMWPVRMVWEVKPCVECFLCSPPPWISWPMWSQWG